jgi:hypothetical protein
MLAFKHQLALLTLHSGHCPAGMCYLAAHEHAGHCSVLACRSAMVMLLWSGACISELVHVAASRVAACSTSPKQGVWHHASANALPT